ncbi:MAG: hypothetical protein NZP74_11495 [Anaerolineales bacterium]|nr:hypothetical protein [Anaerolineales bacterium]
MKKAPFFLLSMFFLLAACQTVPGVAPESVPTALPASETPNPEIPPEYLTQAALPRTIPPSPTDIATETPIPTITPSITPTATPSPTRTPRVFAPAGAGTPVIDFGFPAIQIESVPRLLPIWQAMQPVIRQTALSGDGQKLFVSTANGLFVFDSTGARLAYWRDVFTTSLPCSTCLSVNRDGSLFAVLTRNAGRWEAQVYEVRDVQAKSLRLSIPLEGNYRETENEGLVLLSPDGVFLAYAAGEAPVRVFNLNTGRQVLTIAKPLRNLQFSGDGSRLAVRDGRNLLLYDTQTWDKPTTLLLPANDTPFALSGDSRLLAITFGNRLRIYQIQDLKPTREVTVPDGKARRWQLSFVNETLLRGISVAWNVKRTLATVVIAEWEPLSGQNLRFETFETATLSPFPPDWPSELPLEDSSNGLGVGEYHAFRYITSEMLLIGTPHKVCWVKILSGEQNCVTDPENLLFTTDTIALKEIVQEKRTLLQTWRGETILDVFGDYRVRAVDRIGEWVLIDVRGAAADLYAKGRPRASESVGGAFQAFAETRTLFAYTTQQKNKTFVITIFDKTTGKTIAQQKDVFLLSPLTMSRQGTLLLLKRDLDKGLTIVLSMAPPRYTLREVKRLAFEAEVLAMVYSTQENLLAFALSDGSVVVYSSDLELREVFQAFDSPVTALAFSPDDRFLAAASAEGIRVFAVRP